MYHLQIIKWIKNYKATFGLSNLEIRYGMNASWHSFISLMDINYNSFSIKYYLNSIVLALLINEITVQNIVKKSNVFLFLTVSYLLFFSYIHPFKNGIILNHLGNPEIDIISNIFFILIIYIFFKLDENNYSDLNYTYLLIFFSILCITSRIIFIPVIILVIFLYLKNKKLFLIKLIFF